MRVLHVLHDFLPRYRAGAELYVLHLCKALAARGHEVSVLCAEFDPTRRHLSVERRAYDGLPVIEVVNNWDFASFEETWRSPALGALLRDLLREAAPDVVHVHNLLTLTLEVPEIARSLGLPVVATLHDHGLCCPAGGTRLDALERRVCERLDLARCARCVPASALHRRRAVRGLVRQVGRALPLVAAVRRVSPAALALGERAWARAATRATALGEDDLRRRLEGARRAAAHVDRFVAPSHALARAHVEAGVVEADRVVVVPHGLPRLERSRAPRPADGRLRVGFVGTLAWHKGPHVLVEALRRLPRDRLTVVLHGSAGAAPEYAADLRRRAADLPVIFAGEFHEEQRAAVYGDLNVLVVPSIWPEAWGLVVQEARLAGVAVVASRTGGLAELVRDGEDGLLVAPGSPSELAAALRRLLDEPGLLGRLVAGAPPVRSVEDDAAGWERLYAEAALDRAAAPTTPPQRLAAVIVCYRSPERTIAAARALAAQTRPPDLVVVVDNGGRDQAALRAGLPLATVIATPRNLGFAGGANQGLRAALAAGADAVLLVNDDAHLAPDVVERLERALGPGVAGAGPALVDAADRDTIESLGMTFDLRTGQLRETARGTSYARLAASEPRDVQAVSGCVALLSRAALDEVGLLDEGFFFYFEDLDLCLRARRAGWRVVLDPSAVVWHEGSRSIGRRAPRRLYHAVRGHLRLGRKLGGLAAPRQAAIVGWNLLHALVRHGHFERGALRAVLRGVADHVRDAPHGE